MTSRTFAVHYVRWFLLLGIISLLLLPFSCVPVEAGEIKSCVAVRALDPVLPRGVSRAWGRQSKFWPQKSTVRIRFLSGTKRQKAEAWKRFQQIDALVNLKFAQVTTGPSEVRVRFDKGKGHWSYLGTDARLVPSTAQTMNLDLMAGVFGDGAYEWDRVVLHECLHAIGLSHELQHPNQVIPWNKEAVYSYYGATQGWNKEQVDFQILNRTTTRNDFKGSAFDPASIMCYPVPAFLVTDASFAVGWNAVLSSLDVAVLQQIYPETKTSLR